MSMEENQQTISECLQDVSVEYTTFGKRLRHIRKERGMTQEAFAELLGTSKQILSRYEREDRSPRIEVVRKYAEALKVSADYLLGDDEAEAVSSMFWAQKKEKPFYKIFIEIKSSGNNSCYLRHLESMSHSVSVMLVCRKQKYLGFVIESSE